MSAPTSDVAVGERPSLFETLAIITMMMVLRVMEKAPWGKRRFFDVKDFPWIAELEAHWEDIRDEVAPYLDRPEVVPNFQTIQVQEARLTRDDRWKVMILFGYGVTHEPNVERFPKTAELVRRVPGVTTAMFSILREKKRIPPHRGPYKGVLRYHLALRIPGEPGDCRICVGGEWRTWEEGKSLVFDDTHQHEVWKEVEGTRAILFLDVLRPLPWPLSALNRFTVNALGRLDYVQGANRQLRAWERKHGDDLDALARDD